MVDPLVAVLVGIPVLWHLGLAGFAYYDAGRVGMPRTKWGLIALAVPLFGFFLYLLERSELSYDPDDDPYARGQTKAGFAVHESREGEPGVDPGGVENDANQRRDDRRDGSGADRR